MSSDDVTNIFFFARILLGLARLQTQLLLPELLDDYQIWHGYVQYVWSEMLSFPTVLMLLSPN